MVRKTRENPKQLVGNLPIRSGPTRNPDEESRVNNVNFGQVANSSAAFGALPIRFSTKFPDTKPLINKAKSSCLHDRGEGVSFGGLPVRLLNSFSKGMFILHICLQILIKLL